MKIPDFITWSESEAGFWVDQWFDAATGEWVIENRPIVWHEKQRRALEYLLEFDRKGRLKYSRIVWIDIGKSAKTLIGAAVADYLGRFVPRDAELIIAANSREQAEVRAYYALKASLERNPYVSDIAIISETKIIYRKTDNVVRPVATKAKSQAGTNAIFIDFDEMWGYQGNEARALIAELKPSPTRNVSLVMTTTYPGFKDDDSPLNDVIDEFFDAQENPRDGVEKVPGLEDLPLWTRGNMAFWWNHEPYPWHLRRMRSGMTYLEEQRNDPMVTPGHYLRIWEARRTQRSDVFLPIDRWDACEDEDWTGLKATDWGIPLIIGWDTGRKFNSSAVVARSYDPDTGRYPLYAHRIWGTEHLRGRDPIALAKQWILDLARTQDVLAVYFDPWQLYHVADEMRKLGIKMVECTQNTSRTVADTGYRAHIIQGTLRNYKHSRDLRQHILNAVGRETGAGSIRIERRRSNMDQDGAVADSMCCLGVTEHKVAIEARWRQRLTPAPPRRLRTGVWANVYRLGEGYR